MSVGKLRIACLVGISRILGLDSLTRLDSLFSPSETDIRNLYNSTYDDKLAETEVEVSLDGVKKSFPAGTKLILKTGESITLTSGLYHRFWAEKGKGPLVVGEVSKVNDDNSDNCFLDKVGRFPDIKEDGPPIHYLCTEYPI